MSDEWRDIPNWEGWYQASCAGAIKRVRASKGTRVGRILNPCRHKDGYLVVKLYRDTAFIQFLVHTIIAATFIGPKPDGTEVNHKDGDKRNNDASNLEYVTEN